MTMFLPRACLVLCLFIVSCTQVIPAVPPPDAPRILGFAAGARVVNTNEPVRLSFTTEGATRVSLVDDQGQAIQLEGSVEEGGTEVSPSRTTFYVLRASGPGGVTSAFLQIAVNEPLREAFLLAVPPEVEAGEPVQLLWSAPGASSVTLTERGGMPVTLTGTSGLVPITPATSTGYRLTARGVTGTPPVDALVEVRVTPAIGAFDFMAANGVRVGEPIVFSWATRAAAQLTLSERTLGQITVVTDPGDLAAGTFDFVVPAMTPSGLAISDGFPLHFTLTAASGEAQSTRAVHTAVGNLPAFERVDAPAAVSAGRSFIISWRTLNASRVTLMQAGLPIFETLPSAPDRAVIGSVSLPSPAADTDYVLVASDERGQTASQTIRVRLVQPPVITTFTVPATLSSPGGQVTAQWVTTNAERVTLRLENGASLARVTGLSQVRMGSAMFNLASTAALTLEAVNAAGDVVSETRTIRVFGSAATVSPQPSLRTTTGTATLDWQLGALGVTETVGLAVTSADGGVPAVSGSMNFIDLTASLTAETLPFADPGNGAELIPLGTSGFSFPLAGQLQRQLWVSANGFIAFSQPASLSLNADLGLSSNSTQSMLAPFWDDLAIPATGKVLYELQTPPGAERFLVVQWDKVKLSTTNSELTFQVHLYESGRVTFLYKTLTGMGSSFTVGVKATHENLRQRYQFNTTGGPIAADLELNFFTGGPADGTLPVTTSSSRRVAFFGRTPSGLMPVSADVRTIAVGDLKITEAMPFPEVSAASFGQWVELRNTLSTPVDLDGILLASASLPDAGTLLPPRVLMPGEFVVIGQSTDVTQTGGAPVQVVMTDVPLGPTDSVRLLVQGTAVASLAWDGGTLAQSIFVPEGLLVAAGNVVTCPRSQNFGPNGAFGTPGAANESCGYVITSIPGGFTPGPLGSEVFGSLSGDEGYGNGVLPAPFTYFGTAYTAFSLSNNGFITLGAPLTSASLSNGTTAATTAPNGVIAPFWDDLMRDSGRNAMWRQVDRTIISYENYRPFGSAYTPGTFLNFQIHLIDTGVIEFHYGTISTTSTSQTVIDRIAGNSATVWIERPDGVLVVPHRINQLNGVVPNSGLRFTPAP
ncbi:MAG: lamin tail domain-containing protein [Archangium sp.]|nr:lamin tail domain-containing protein [Archangium sp.]MDP3157215.1 lamin tail domain-containing protein [Archangium sp.]MDP3576273.1 lamin tail domain-containing protein [Archangium sp.]